MSRALPQFDFIFALGLLFAFLDAWNIGANDVANSFATSVSSRSLTLVQAMIIATVMEFLGAVTVGARVADTIRSKILKIDRFEEQPEVLMLGMMCALIGSSTWLTVATKIGLPVSTTHCIVGGVIGMGIAALGADGVVWGWEGKGVAQIFASWFIAPAFAGVFAALIFLITKYAVLLRRNPLRNGLFSVPMYFGFTSGILTMLIVWKGAATLNADGLSTGQIVGTIFGVAGGVMLLCCFFFLPYLYCKLVKEDRTVRLWEMYQGPLLLKRDTPPHEATGDSTEIIQDYYRGHATKDDIEAANQAKLDASASGSEKFDGITVTQDVGQADDNKTTLADMERKDMGQWWLPENLPRSIYKVLMHGVHQDVVSQQSRGGLSGNIQAIHAEAAHYDNKTEHLYSFLQVLTAATSSFAHGANDISNAVAPLATIYLVWNTDTVAKKAPVPIWVLCYCAAALCIGLWTYGYNIMRNLGNRLTLHSPTRGFSMELGSAITVVFATRLELPVSTTQCIIGATVGVALCNGTIKATNWRMVGWCYLGWVLTLPIAGIISGCLMGIIINSPRWGMPVN